MTLNIAVVHGCEGERATQRELEDLLKRYDLSKWTFTTTVPPPEGAANKSSTYLHIIVNALEYFALDELLGVSRARAALEARPFYTWIYQTVIRDAAAIRAVLEEHGLMPLNQPS